MRIAVVCETSTADRHGDVLKALEGRGHEVFSAGMTRSGASPELSYIQTGFISALLLNAGRADLIVGGCGTGQGYLNAVMQYPGVFCGLIQDPMDAWLFRQINDGNCISLALQKGYGWAADVNLGFLFDRFFSVEAGGGYPPHRAEPQRASRGILHGVTQATHKPFAQIVRDLDVAVVGPALGYPGVAEAVDAATLADADLKAALQARMAGAASEA